MATPRLLSALTMAGCLLCSTMASAQVQPSIPASASQWQATMAQGSLFALPTDQVRAEATGSKFALETVVPAESQTLAGAAATDGPILAARTKRGRREPKSAAPAPHTVLTAERARVLLRSLTVPGWGQATIGARTSSTVFLIAEAGVWASFTAFRVQEQMRREAFERTARVLGGIDLNGRDEEFRRIVGSYISNEEYNLLVVARDAATLYYSKPDSMNWYIAQNELKGADTWSWVDEGALLRYRGQRKDAQRARLRTSTALGLAVVNRVFSVIHAARASSRMAAPTNSLRFEAAPVPGSDPTAFRLGVRTDF